MKILYDILNNRQGRSALIRKFQEHIWNGNPEFKNLKEENILRDLAYDLDFYQSDEKLRSEDASFYGDEKLEQEIKSAITKLEENKIT
jgi:hypothetical protein